MSTILRPEELHSAAANLHRIRKPDIWLPAKVIYLLSFPAAPNRKHSPANPQAAFRISPRPAHRNLPGQARPDFEVDFGGKSIPETKGMAILQENTWQAAHQHGMDKSWHSQPRQSQK